MQKEAGRTFWLNQTGRGSSGSWERLEPQVVEAVMTNDNACATASAGPSAPIPRTESVLSAGLGMGIGSVPGVMPRVQPDRLGA